MQIYRRFQFNYHCIYFWAPTVACSFEMHIRHQFIATKSLIFPVRFRKYRVIDFVEINETLALHMARFRSGHAIWQLLHNFKLEGLQITSNSAQNGNNGSGVVLWQYPWTWLSIEGYKLFWVRSLYKHKILDRIFKSCFNIIYKIFRKCSHAKLLSRLIDFYFPLSRR